MYDPVTLDQLRAFVTVVETGSFSAAARKLQRVQSAISTSMANLESQLRIPIWDRTTRVAKLTEQGQALLAATRRVLGEVDALRRLSAGLLNGVEASVSLCVDALFPLDALIELCAGFAKEFPTVDLRVDTQVMSVVTARVLGGSATLGVVSPGGMKLAAGLERQPLMTIRMVSVVSPAHPLAAFKGPIPRRQFADVIQIVLSERTDHGVDDIGVLSACTWRIADLHTKHMMLRAGLGWGNLPEHLIRDDLRTKKLVAIQPGPWAKDEHTLHLSAIYKSDLTFGPAHRWILSRLEARDLARALPKKPGKERGRSGVRLPDRERVHRGQGDLAVVLRDGGGLRQSRRDDEQ
jgi:DNA-binding transcriptional LysR family regulator